jgi:hypothetical protein
MHLDDEQLQRFFHRELEADVRRSAGDHLTTCAECRDRLSRLERDEKEVYRLLEAADSPAPAVTAKDIIVMAGTRRSGRGRWAAGILLAALVAGAAYALPGSPVRDWIRDARARVQRDRPTPKPTERPMPLMAGLAVPPGDHLVIIFERTYPRSNARVSLGEWNEVRVRGPSGGATFGSEADTLRIGNRDSTATFEVEIPSEARHVEIRVAGARIFAKEGHRIVAPGADDGDEVYLLPLTAP